MGVRACKNALHAAAKSDIPNTQAVRVQRALLLRSCKVQHLTLMCYPEHVGRARLAVCTSMVFPVCFLLERCKSIKLKAPQAAAVQNEIHQKHNPFDVPKNTLYG